MSYWDKVRKKETQKKQEEKALLNTLGWLTVMTCGFLETRHGYKAAGLKKFIDYVAVSLKESEGNIDFFLGYYEHFKDEYNLDILAELGLDIER